MARKSKVKWTQQMNTDVLECKRKVHELVTSGNAPFNRGPISGEARAAEHHG